MAKATIWMEKYEKKKENEGGWKMKNQYSE